MVSNDNKTSREKTSKIPSWIMVGFVLGALSFYTVNDYLKVRAEKERARAAASQPPVSPPVEKPAPAPADPDAPINPLSHDNNRALSLFAIDYIFRKWSVNAFWDYNTTQVVFYNPADNQYSVFVEVTRRGPDDEPEYYYRIIDEITRPLVREGVRSDAPILFTESEEATREREKKRPDMWGR